MSFKDIKGQDGPLSRLKEYIAHSRVACGYLFLGPEGVGKRLIARTFAKALNCLEQAQDSCDRCPPCLKIDKYQHPDVHFVNFNASTQTFDRSNNYALFELKASASEAIKIEDIRQLQKDINLKPYEARRKVFIIDNAHNLTAEASNALLKILEEPPVNSLIILISAKPTLLFRTIISRCQIIKFYPLPRLRLKQALKEDYNLDEDSAHFLAYFSEGRLGLALRLKDSDILAEKNSIIDEYALFRGGNLDRPALLNRDNAKSILNLLAGWFRDIYLIKTGMPHSQLINFDRRYDLLKFINRYSFSDLDQILRYISDSLALLDNNINIKLLMSNLRWSLKG